MNLYPAIVSEKQNVIPIRFTKCKVFLLSCILGMWVHLQVLVSQVSSSSTPAWHAHLSSDDDTRDCKGMWRYSSRNCANEVHSSHASRRRKSYYPAWFSSKAIDSAWGNPAWWPPCLRAGRRSPARVKRGFTRNSVESNGTRIDLYTSKSTPRLDSLKASLKSQWRVSRWYPRILRSMFRSINIAFRCVHLSLSRNSSQRIIIPLNSRCLHCCWYSWLYLVIERCY